MIRALASAAHDSADLGSGKTNQPLRTKRVWSSLVNLADGRRAVASSPAAAAAPERNQRNEHSSPTRTALATYEEVVGVCRDFTHLAITFCRCMNIPARYCTGYVTDIGQPLPYEPTDFAAWIEVYLGGHWRLFDPRSNPRGSAAS